MTTQVLDAARTHLDEALREESEALVNACAAVKTSGAASTEAVEALRSAQSAHARSNLAVSEVRALNAEAERVEAAGRGPADAKRRDPP